MQPDKKQIEVLLIDYFRNCYSEFPKGKIKPSESPDFLIDMKTKHQLGIELTRLNPANALIPDDDSLNEIYFRERLIAITKELFEHHSEVKLFVKILFSEDKKINRQSELAVAAKLSNLIRKHIQDRYKKSFFTGSIHKHELPEGLEEILIVHHPKLEIAVWERSNNLGVSNNVLDDIKKAIHKKDEKLRLYQKQKLNYYWLLITTDRLRGVKSFNLPNKILNHNFHSQFQHVFLFDLIKSKVYELV